MEMEQSRNGGGKVVSFQEATIGRRRNPTYLDVDAGRVAQPQGMGSRRRTYADGELDVFAAERYFKGAMDGDHRKEDVAAAAVAVPVETVGSSAKPAVAVAKPASTRASVASTNSQTVLLRGGGHRRRCYHDRKCCVQVGVLMRTCSGKRSVRVDDGGAAKEAPGGTGEPAPAASSVDWYRELRMHKAALGLAGDHGGNHGVVTAGLPPNLNIGRAKVAAIVGRETMIRDEKPAAEFTCSSSSRKRSFTLVAPVRDTALASSHGGGGGGDDDDGAGSESSSDLFEIKSLMIDDSPYEPSEASVQWSVATASACAADASERGDRAAARWVGGGGGGRQRPVGLLAGCVSHRAVEVSAATAAVPKAPAIVAMRRRIAGEGFQKARNGA